jgi:hypothetical protein
MKYDREGEAVFVVGSRGSGKSEWTRRRVRRERRLLVWDAVKEWSRDRIVAPCLTLRDLQQLILADILRPGEFRVGYVGPAFYMTPKGVKVSYFPTFCAMAWPWMQRKPGTLVVEELADVTHPGKAPPFWGEIVREGRHSGSNVYAITQRPAESDKTIEGNADIIHCGRLSRPGDRRHMAEALDVPVADLTALASLEYIERDMRNRKLSRGRLTF